MKIAGRLLAFFGLDCPKQQDSHEKALVIARSLLTWSPLLELLGGSNAASVAVSVKSTDWGPLTHSMGPLHTGGSKQSSRGSICSARRVEFGVVGSLRATLARMSSLSMIGIVLLISVRPVLPREVGTLHSRLDHPTGPTLFGLRIGMSVNNLAQTLVGAKSDESPRFGTNLIVSRLPSEHNLVLTERHLYFKDDRLYKVYVRGQRALSEGFFPDEAALETYKAMAIQYGKSFRRIGNSHIEAPPSFTCEGGPSAAKDAVDSLQSDNWANLRVARRTMLAMQCGAIEAWNSTFSVGPGETLQVGVYPGVDPDSSENGPNVFVTFGDDRTEKAVVASRLKLDHEIGPSLFGVRVGMSDQSLAMLGGKVTVRSRRLGLTFRGSDRVPDEGHSPFYLAAAGYWFRDGRLYDFGVELLKPNLDRPDDQMHTDKNGHEFYYAPAFRLDPDAAETAFQGFIKYFTGEYGPPIEDQEESAPASFLCPYGSPAARSSLPGDADTWSQLSQARRDVLAMHCGVIKPWNSWFSAGAGVQIGCELDVAAGGGSSASIHLVLQDRPVHDASEDALKKEQPARVLPF